MNTLEVTYEYDLSIPSNLKEKNIIMVGRANDGVKRYDLGIKSIVNIIKEIPNFFMNIVSSLNPKL